MFGTPLIKLQKPKISISCFLKDIDPIFKFSRIYKTDLTEFPARVFSKKMIFGILIFPKRIYLQMILNFLVCFEVILQSQSQT